MDIQDPLPPPPQPQAWLPPARLPNVNVANGQYAPPPMYELRPLTTSEVLDRTFAIYRSHFWLFAGIASFSGALQSVVAGVQMLFQGRLLSQAQHVPQPQLGLPPVGVALPILIGLFATVVYFLAYTVTNAACVFALGETYLGRATTIAQSFRATAGRWYAYLGIAVWQAASFMWLPLLLLLPGMALIIFGAMRSPVFAAVGGVLLFVGITAGFIVGYIFYLRNAFGVPVAVLERMQVRPAMRRSKVLTDGTKWRLLLIWLITMALFMVVGVLQSPLAFLSLMMIAKGGHAYITQALALVVGFIGHTVVTPVAMIGVSLLYFDQRVRKEAFDIAFLLGEEQALVPGAPLTPVGAPTQPQQTFHGTAL